MPFCKRALRVRYALANSIRSAPLSVSVALNLSPSDFVLVGLYPCPVQPEEPPTLRKYLLRKLDGRLLLGAYPEQNPQQLRNRERPRPLGQKPLPRP